jgi:UDP-2-acetamido-2,6-beta-L-arabino-hexul-4-ose reductase
MIKIGITGQNGFIGYHLYNTLSLNNEKYQLVNYEKIFFDVEEELDTFVRQCDVIVHLAAMNRHPEPTVIYNTNIELVEKLVASLNRTESNALVIMSSSTQEEKDNLYGKSKKEGRDLLIDWANKSKGIFTGLIIPNVFGPFGKPNYNSVVATFCHKISICETPEIQIDSDLNLIYVGELVKEILQVINNKIGEKNMIIQATTKVKVSEILDLLNSFKNKYQDNGEIPNLNSVFQLNLFNTFRCYMDIKNHFPIKFKKHTDPRGSFVEIIRLGVGGQMSFSTTVPGVTRGNHFHTRKIERFAVIKGKALIQLRRIGTEEVIDFYLDGDNPAYVDMPIWYTHNIKNIGDDILYTNFWISEPYNADDADTYFVNV